MPTVLITGANRGIGREFARQYLAGGWRVVATCRDPAQYDLEGEVLPLDVADGASIAALAERLSGEAIDLVVNNAGIGGPENSEFGHIDYNGWAETLRVNLMGPIRMAEAFVEAVARSDMRKMAFVTSRMGSIADNSSGGEYAYRTSKTALNMAVRSLSIDLAPKGVICVLLHPGWVKTDMGGKSAPIDAATSVAGMRAAIERATKADNGRFLNYEGKALPW